MSGVQMETAIEKGTTSAGRIDAIENRKRNQLVDFERFSILSSAWGLHFLGWRFGFEALPEPVVFAFNCQDLDSMSERSSVRHSFVAERKKGDKSNYVDGSGTRRGDVM